MRSTPLGKYKLARQWTRGTRAWDPLGRRMRTRGPYGVAIQTIDRCNAACVMCPYAELDHSAPARRMEDSLFTRILEQARDSGTVRVIVLTLQNEPLLDHRLAARVAEVRQVLGDTVAVVVVSHGALLTPDRVHTLAGVTRFEISIDAASSDTYARIRPGLDFDAVRANVEALLAAETATVAVKFVVQRDNRGEEETFANYWKARGAEVSIDRLCNRAGALDTFAGLRTSRAGVFRRLGEYALGRLVPCCPLPFTTVDVLVDGRVILCSHDWGPLDIVGDLATQTLEEVWNGEPINHYRDLLWTGRHGDSAVCRDCSIAESFWKW